MNPSPNLVAAVDRINGLHGLINAKIPAIVSLFAPLVGTKIKKTSGYGGFTEKIKKLIDDSGIEFSGNVRISVQMEYSSLYVKFNIWDNGRNLYDSVYVGSVSNDGVLKDCVVSEKSLRAIYDAEQIASINQKIIDKEKELEALKQEEVTHFRGLV